MKIIRVRIIRRAYLQNMETLNANVIIIMKEYTAKVFRAFEIIL